MFIDVNDLRKEIRNYEFDFDILLKVSCSKK